jgi:group II intron reverse transcriptase/maturase
MKRKTIARLPREKFDLGYDMKEVHLWVLNKQEEIARAKRGGDLVLTEELGQELVLSDYGRVAAIQHVASNRGSRSPGLSVKEFRTNQDYADMMETLLNIVVSPEDYKCTPLDRIYIPKKDGRQRPLSIPSYTDRCLQALYKLALEPISEEVADVSSYGFRPIRGISWAVGRTLNAIANPLTKYGFVVEVDIMGCFDNISHDFILQTVPLIPKVILKEWLKCGYVERDDTKVYETKDGVPQGGIFSPLLSNLTLDGLEVHIRKRILMAKSGSLGSCFCRYADDMIVLTTTLHNANIALEAIKEFLAIRGLQVKDAKTRIRNIYESSFEFLGFQFSLVHRRNRKRKVARIGIPLSAIRNFRSKIKEIMHGSHQQHTKIELCNGIIRGWAYNYRFAHNSMYVFRGLRYWLWKQLYYSCYKVVQSRFDKANHKEIHERVMAQFFAPYNTYITWPQLHDKSGKLHVLFDITTVDYTPAVFTNQARNAFIYEDRNILDRYSLMTKTRFNQVILERWFGCCALCRKRLDLNPIPYELHHILPKRFDGSDSPNNLAPLCKAPCHNQVSTAVQRRDVPALLEFINLGVLSLPIDYLATQDSP